MTAIPTIQLECKKDGLQQLQNGTWKLSLTVNGDDMEKAIGTLGKAPMGTIYMVAMAEVGDDGQPRDRAKEEDAKKKREVKESERCAMLCRYEDFQEWLSKNYEPVWVQNSGMEHNHLPVARMFERIAEMTVKAIIGSSTRKVLDSDPEGEPSKRWLRMKAQFEQDSGKIAEKRR